MQVERFLVESIRHSAIFYHQLEVEEDCGVGALGYLPTEFSEFVKIFLEAFPHSSIKVGIRAVPDANYIIDVSLVEEEESCIPSKDGLLFIDSEVEGGVHGGWWGTHCGAGELEPVSVSELEEVILHDDGDGLHDGLVSFRLREEASDFGDGVVGVDVGVH